MAHYTNMHAITDYPEHSQFMVSQLLAMAHHYKPNATDPQWCAMVSYVMSHMHREQQQWLIEDLAIMGVRVAPPRPSSPINRIPEYMIIDMINTLHTPTSNTTPAPEPWVFNYQPTTGLKAPGAPRKLSRQYIRRSHTAILQ